MSTATRDERPLTPGQALFAVEHDAHPGLHAIGDDRNIFLYHRTKWITYRWLVNDAGRSVDVASFHR